MKAFIKSIGSISPYEIQEGLASQSLPEINEKYAIAAREPDYSRWITDKQLRRMSRILKMGITSGLMALENGSIKPDGIHAIITGTGFGCLEDTETFLMRMIRQQEQMLNPTPFMQSTHNTIGAQTAILLQCQGYNQTYVQGAFSFEHALLDTMMYLDDNPRHHALLIGVDEWTEVSHAIHKRFGKFRPASSYSSDPAGEGATSFVLTGMADDARTIASVEGVKTLYKPDHERLTQEILFFLKQHSIEPEAVDLLLLGGASATTLAIEGVFSDSSIGYFKRLCGEYNTATSFAAAMATVMLKDNCIPEIIFGRDRRRRPEIILIYSTCFGIHHSLILLKSCRHIAG